MFLPLSRATGSVSFHLRQFATAIGGGDELALRLITAYPLEELA